MAYNLIHKELAPELFYHTDGDVAELYGAVGYLRADFGRSGKEFWHSWFNIQQKQNTSVFRRELSEVIDSLRNDGTSPPFASRDNLFSYCSTVSGLDLSDRGVGYTIQTLDYTYCIRCCPIGGDYDIYCLVYMNEHLFSVSPYAGGGQ
jgi:hypothetical protein